MTIREAVEIYLDTKKKIEEVNAIVNVCISLKEKGVREIKGLNIDKVQKHMLNYLAVLEYDLDEEFAN